jgi:tetratricopeptide (TPR) repeat protein
MKAIMYLDKSISIKPSAQAYMSLADIKIETEKYEEALKSIKKAEEIAKSKDFQPVIINYSNPSISKYEYPVSDRGLMFKRRRIERMIRNSRQQ